MSGIRLARICACASRVADLQAQMHMIFLSAFCRLSVYDFFSTLKMSTASKITLGSTLLGTVGIVVFVHWAQGAEKKVSFT